MVSRDGPRVNQSLITKLNNKLIAERGFGLVDAGSCPAHIIHNSVKYALKEYGSEVSEVAKVVYYYYDVRCFGRSSAMGGVSEKHISEESKKVRALCRDKVGHAVECGPTIARQL